MFKTPGSRAGRKRTVSAAGGITQLTGDVSAGPGSGSQAATIANNAVTTAKVANSAITYAKIQDISATARLLGRGSVGAGVTEELSLGAGLAISGGVLNTVGGTGGSGNVIYSTAVGSEPGSPNTGDADLYTNGAGQITRYSGSAWVPWGPMFAFTAPDNSAFSWANQGGASVDTTNGGIYMTGTAGGNNIRYRFYTAPSTPYTIILALFPVLTLADFMQCGFSWSDGTKYVNFGPAAAASSTSGLAVSKWTNATTFSADYLSPLGISTQSPLLFLKAQDNGTNRICSWSMDGQHWIQLHSIGRTDFLTASRVGFYTNGSNATWAPAMMLLSWAQS